MDPKTYLLFNKSILKNITIKPIKMSNEIKLKIVSGTAVISLNGSIQHGKKWGEFDFCLLSLRFILAFMDDCNTMEFTSLTRSGSQPFEFRRI